MTLTELRYVTVLAKVQHFGRAAEQCNVSQPTLSIAVKKLESELGVEIFERTKSLVRPTPVGEKIVQQSRRVLEESAVIKDLATLGKDQLSVPLHVGAIFTIGPYLFPSFICTDVIEFNLLTFSTFNSIYPKLYIVFLKLWISCSSKS